MDDVSKPQGRKKPGMMPDWLRGRQTSTDRASSYMLELYRTNLEVRLRCIDEQSLTSESQRRVYADVSETIKCWSDSARTAHDVDWDEACKTERLMASLLGGARLRQEINTRLQDLAAEGVTEAARLRSEYQTLLKAPPGAQSAPADESALRSLLLRVLEAIHWAAKKKYLVRPIRKEASKILLWCVILAFFLMILPYIAINFDNVKGTLSPLWSLFALWTALMAGLMGALFSRLMRLQRRWSAMPLDEVFLHREVSYTLLRAGLGMCGALIVYFFLRSGLLGGDIFPDFDKIAMVLIKADADDPALGMAFVVPSTDLALLTIWCFIAGFSEALVPSILSNTERRISNNEPQAPKPAE
jgi:hypothetical protein